MQDNGGIDRLKQRIRGTLQKERLIILSAGLIGTTAALIATSIILSILAGVVILPVWLKLSLLNLAAVIALYLFWKLCLTGLLAGSEETTAIKLEKKYPQLKGRLIAAIQFTDSPENRRQGYSHDLIKATLIQAEKESTGLEFNKIISAYPILRNLKTLAGSALLAVLLLVIFPGLFSYSYQVYSNPTEMIAPPLGYSLDAYPGNTVAVKYRDVELGGILKGDQFPEKASIFYRFSGGTWQNTEINLVDHSSYQSAMGGDSLQFVTTLKQVRRSLDYYVRAGRLTTPVAHIDVVDRPRVTGIKLSLFYPEYTGLSPTVIDENDGTISALFGTRVNMKIETNLPPASATMVFGDSSRSPFAIDGNTGEQSFRIDKDRRYYIRLVDHQGEINPNPIEYRMTAVPDEYPVITVVRPGVDINLNEEMLVPLQLRISDDYGFTSLQLKYSIVSSGRRSDETVAVLHFSDRIKTEGEINFNWDVEPLHLMPSDYIIYYFELADNDMISGPKITKSREYIARLPSLDEIIAQTEREQGRTINRAEEFYRQHKDLSERLKNIARKIEQDRAQMDEKLSWQHQKELEEITAEEEKIAEELKKTAENLDNIIDKMQENRLGNLDIMEKLAEIQKLFEEVATPEMKEARLRLLEALKNMDPKKIEEALKDYQMSQEDLMERLNRTIALLKRMKIEQKINAMTEMAKQLADKQEKVNEKTSQSEKEELPSLAPEEQKIKEGLKNLKEQSAQLREMLKETPYGKPQEAESFCQAVENTDANEDMESMQGNLKKKAQQEALQDGRRAYSKLMKMASELQQGQASMCRGSGAEAAQKMREAINDIKYLSDNQEDLIMAADEIRGGSEVLRDIAAQQQVLKESISGLGNRISQLGQQSPFIAAELNNLMRQVTGNTDLAIDQLSNRRRLEAIRYQREALSNLNRVAVRMLDALESQNNCNSGSNCNKPTQLMQGLAQRQNQLNLQTQSQCQNQGQSDNVNPEIMKRLAAEQNAIGKSLQELQQEFGDSRDILGRLDAINEDMEKVADALSEGEVGQETLERQLKIHSRMLDATRTLQRKDFTEQRRAKVGEDIIRNSPAALTGNHLRGGLDIEDRLKQFLDENYPEEYEQHIKAYFKALLENSDYYSPAETNESR